MQLLLQLLSLLFLVNPPPSENRTWDGGGTDNLWSTPENWDNDLVPETDADVFIDTNFQVIFNSLSDTIESITLRGGASLTIAEDATLHTTKGGPTGSDAVRLEGNVNSETTLIIDGTLNIKMNGAAGDGIDLSKYTSLLINTSGQLWIADTGDDGIELDDDINNYGFISISNTGGDGINFGNIVPGGATIHNHNSGSLFIFDTDFHGIKLNSMLSLINDGAMSIFDCPGKIFEGNNGFFTNNGTFSGNGLVDADNFINGDASILLPGVPIGSMDFDEDIHFSNQTITFDIEGTLPTLTYDQIGLESGQSIMTNTSLSLAGSYTPAAEDFFTIIDNRTNNPISGTFNNLPQGATIDFNGETLMIDYMGGDGNDVVLTYIESVNINELRDKGSMKVYPTLVEEQLFIENDLGFEKNTKLVIKNSVGRSIQTMKIIPQQKRIEIIVSDLQNGLYYIVVEDNKGIQSFPFVKY